MSLTETSDWYDRFYSTGPQKLSPWYKSILNSLRRESPSGHLLELGSGAGRLLLELKHRSLLQDDSIFGIEQSSAAVQKIAGLLPNVRQGDIQQPLPFADSSFECVVLSEVLEHLLQPWDTIREIRRILKPGGRLFLSFPNYLNLPWLAVRILSEILEKPNWIVLQPIDRMYIYPIIARHLKTLGFEIKKVEGTVFLPPLLDRLEPQFVTSSLNTLGLGTVSFHPVVEAIAD